MQVSSAFNSPVTSGVSNKPITPTKNSVRSPEPVSEVEQDLPSNKQTKSSIVIDEQALAHFEQNQASLSTQTQQSNSFASQDQPSAKNETAVASYQAVGDIAKRESVQQMFGVDLFA